MKLKDFIAKNKASWGGTARRKIPRTSARDQEIIRLVAALKPERAAIIADRLGVNDNTAYCAMNRLAKAGKLKKVHYWDVCED